MMTEIKKNVEVTKRDYTIYKYTEFLGSILKDIGMLLTPVLFGLVYYISTIMEVSFWMLAISALPMLLYIYILVYQIPKSSAVEYELSTYKKMKPLFVIDGENLHVQRQSGSTSVIAFSQLRSFWETRKYFYFFITKQNVLILPKRQLSSEELKFMHETAKKLSGKQKKNPYRVTVKGFIVSFFTMAFITFCIVMIILSFTMDK